MGECITQFPGLIHPKMAFATFLSVSGRCGRMCGRWEQFKVASREFPRFGFSRGLQSMKQITMLNRGITKSIQLHQLAARKAKGVKESEMVIV